MRLFIALFSAVVVGLLSSSAFAHSAPQVNHSQSSSLKTECMASKKAICVSKTERKLRFVVNGKVRLVIDARFGDPRGIEFRTAEGRFTVFRKEVKSWSIPYEVWLPYSMYFYGGQAVHYSHAFAREGYNGSSHGCVNIRDMNKIRWLYNRVPVGTPVYVFS